MGINRVEDGSLGTFFAGFFIFFFFDLFFTDYSARMKLVFLFGLLLSADSFYPNSFGDKASVADKAAQNAPQEKELATHEAKIEAGGRALLRTRQNAIYNHLGQDITKERAEEERGKTLSGEEYAEWNEAHWGVDLFDV